MQTKIIGTYMVIFFQICLYDKNIIHVGYTYIYYHPVEKVITLASVRKKYENIFNLFNFLLSLSLSDEIIKHSGIRQVARVF